MPLTTQIFLDTTKDRDYFCCPPPTIPQAFVKPHFMATMGLISVPNVSVCLLDIPPFSPTVGD